MNIVFKYRTVLTYYLLSEIHFQASMPSQLTMSVTIINILSLTTNPLCNQYIHELRIYKLCFTINSTTNLVFERRIRNICESQNRLQHLERLQEAPPVQGHNPVRSHLQLCTNILNSIRVTTFIAGELFIGANGFGGGRLTTLGVGKYEMNCFTTGLITAFLLETE